jgi:hypothetical protein
MSRAWLSRLAFIVCLFSAILRFAAKPVRIAHAQTSLPVSASLAHTGYVGDSACLHCHQEQAALYPHTTHALSAQLPSKSSILGSFKDGENILRIAAPAKFDLAPALSFKMDARNGSYYQTAVVGSGELQTRRSERIGLVIGSGTRGQTYLYWAGDKLYELPVSYWSEGRQWINSPGYQDGTADFGRPVDPRCLECHTSYILPRSPDLQGNIYEKASLIPGISCESCHGPGADHVAREQKHSATTTDHAILNPAKFVRDRQVDQCALCHDGTQSQELKPAFSYLPGQPLDEYLSVDPTTITNQPDVHGNQVGLLKKSRCYLSSPTMSCSTCHNVHQPERPAAAYSDRCLSCHTWQSCGASRTLGSKITHNCIDCHMPLQQTNAIVSVTAKRVLRTSIRTHWIKVYPDAVNHAVN